MLLSKRFTTCGIIFSWIIVMGLSISDIIVSERIDTTNSTHEYSENIQDWIISKEGEVSTIKRFTQGVNLTSGVDTEIKTLINTNDSHYEVPINTAPHIKSGKVLEGQDITINIDDLIVYLDAEYENYSWDTKRRIKDIYILKEILVNQLGVAPTKAAAVIGNICHEDSFAGLTNSAASIDNIHQAKNVLGDGGRGYGCVQWTAAYRQKGLKDYYEVISKDLDWELTSVIAETAYLYNELQVSGILGDLTEDGNLEHLTGVVGCVYEAYAASTTEWYQVNGLYKTDGCNRYTYAKHIYELIVSEDI